MRVVGSVDHDAVLQQITEDSGWSGRYAFLILVSAAIALIGLLMPSVAVVIGAMLLSPLMMPIIGLGFGIATLDFREMRRASFALLSGSAMAVALSVVLVSISPVQTITTEIAGRTQPTLFDLLVALLSALAGAYALIRGRGGTVVGVAIATALMPPLAVIGFGIATLNWTVFSGSLLLFATNAITIALAAALVARIHGFGSHLSRRHTGLQLTLFVVALGLLSVPLGAALRAIAFEATAQRQVRDMVRAHFPDVARLSQLEIDEVGGGLRVRAVVLTPHLDPGADNTLSTAIGGRLGRPVDLHVDQVRVSLDSGAAEAAQIARASGSTDPSADARRADAVADLANIAGADAASIRADTGARTLAAVAAPLPGLGVEGYRALEMRARGALPGWTVALAPPPDAALPAVPVTAGVVDVAALDIAAWGSLRSGRAVSVRGGTAAQRTAIAAGIVARGAQAETGPSDGQLRLEWVEGPETAGE